MFGKNKDAPEIVVGERVSIMTLEEDLSIDAQTVDREITLPAPRLNTEWSQPGGNSTHEMGHLSLKGNLKPIWKTSIGAGTDSKTRLTASPILADGKIFVLDARAHVSAIDAETGKKLWRVKLVPEGEKPASGLGGGLTYAVGQIYVATGFGEVFALDPENGEIIWRKNNVIPFHTAPVAESGRIYVSSVDNQLHALSAFDGRSLWTHRSISEGTGIFLDTNPAVVDDLVIAPFTSGELVALRIQNGQQVWGDALTRSGRMSALSDLKSIAARPVASGGQVYAVSHSGRMVAIDIRTGERIWARNIASIQTPWVVGSQIFNVTIDGELISMARSNGKVRWISQFINKLDPKGKKPVQWVGPILAGNQLIILSSHGRLVSVSPYTGAVMQEVKIGAGVFVSPIVANDTLYVLNDKGNLIAFKGDHEITAAEALAAVPAKVDESGRIDATGKKNQDSFWGRITRTF